MKSLKVENIDGKYHEVVKVELEVVEVELAVEWLVVVKGMELAVEWCRGWNNWPPRLGNSPPEVLRDGGGRSRCS